MTAVLVVVVVLLLLGGAGGGGGWWGLHSNPTGALITPTKSCMNHTRNPVWP